MKIKEILNELLHYGYNEVEGKEVLVIDKYIFVYDKQNTQLIIDRINSIFDKGLESLRPFEIIQKGFAGAIMGKIKNNVLELYKRDEWEMKSPLNKQIQKLVTQLNLDGAQVTGIDYEKDNIETVHEFYDREDIVKNIADTIFYHGTSYNNFKSIIKSGIYKKDSTSNFEKIVHKKFVFITTSKIKAIFHARNATKNDGSIPIIIALKVPDKDQLVLDFDIAMIYYGKDHELVKALGYDLISSDITNGDDSMHDGNKHAGLEKWKQLADKNSLNTKVGHFGYSGRIPPSHFVGYYTDAEAIAEHSAYTSGGDTKAIKYIPDPSKSFKKYSSLSELQKDIEVYSTLHKTNQDT